MLLRSCLPMVGLFFAACGSVKTPGPACENVVCDDGEVCVDGVCVEADPCLDVECDPGQLCLEGSCLDPVIDEDGDGYDASVDCDDDDDAVFPGESRACSTECGEGTELCQDGVFQDCSAPAPPCTCKDGETLSEPCGNCGTSTRGCEDGLWAEIAGPCEDEGDCPASTNPSQDCPECGTQFRTCDAACQWIGEWSPCVGPLVPELSERCFDATPFCNSAGVCVSG